MNNSQVKQNVSGVAEGELPFILNYLVERKNAAGPTTSGTWEDMDAADYA